MRKFLVCLLCVTWQVTACGQAATITPAATAAPLVATPVPPTLTPTIASKPPTAVESVSLTTEDNVTLSATLFGQGKLAVILAHQGTEGADQKSWQPFAQVLAA